MYKTLEKHALLSGPLADQRMGTPLHTVTWQRIIITTPEGLMNKTLEKHAWPTSLLADQQAGTLSHTVT